MGKVTARSVSNMKLLLVAASLVLAASAEYASMQDYHRAIGIPAAARIKATEEAQDFDGSRIAGGTEPALGALPHFAGLLIILTNGLISVCGSSILTNTRLVTAAHCWSTPTTQGHQFTVVFASLRLYSGGLRINTRLVEQHADFNPRTSENDIAIITVPHVAYTAHISNINIATGSDLFVGSWAVVAGFGGDGVALFNDILRKVSVQIVTNDVCAGTFSGRVFESSICVATSGGKSPCLGDAGGPLAIGSGNSGTLVGVLSYTHFAGCIVGHPAVFTRVSSYAEWIRERL